MVGWGGVRGVALAADIMLSRLTIHPMVRPGLAHQNVAHQIVACQIVAHQIVACQIVAHQIVAHQIVAPV